MTTHIVPVGFDYERRIKVILKKPATNDATVGAGTVLSYIREHTEPISPEYRATIQLWLPRIDANDDFPDDFDIDATQKDAGEPDGYDDSTQ